MNGGLGLRFVGPQKAQEAQKGGGWVLRSLRFLWPTLHRSGGRRGSQSGFTTYAHPGATDVVMRPGGLDQGSVSEYSWCRDRLLSVRTSEEGLQEQRRGNRVSILASLGHKKHKKHKNEEIGFCALCGQPCLGLCASASLRESIRLCASCAFCGQTGLENRN